MCRPLIRIPMAKPRLVNSMDGIKINHRLKCDSQQISYWTEFDVRFILSLVTFILILISAKIAHQTRPDGTLPHPAERNFEERAPS